MIQGMVERLAERLKRDGSDVDGWLRLARSYMVLGDRDKARATAADARRALASDAGQAAPDRRIGQSALGDSKVDAAGADDAMTARTTPRRDRVGAWAILALAVALVLFALRDLIVFFNSPTDVVEKQIKAGTAIRLGGLVKAGSIVRVARTCSVRFDVTDGKNTIAVAYRGLLPDLFREGQGVVTEGALDGAGTFQADNVLAKHDETYMPKEVADALKKQGHWKVDDGKQAGPAPSGRAQ